MILSLYFVVNEAGIVSSSQGHPVRVKHDA